MGKGTEKRGKWVKMLQQGYVLENESGCGTFQVGVQEGICEEVAFGQRLEDERELARGGLGEECSSRGNRPFLSPHVAFRGEKDEFLGARPVWDPLIHWAQLSFQTGISLSPVWLVAVTSAWLCLVLGR